MMINFQKYLNVFRLPEERHQKVLAQIKESAKPDLDFFVLTIFAAVIITLGLILNNSSVVIGGMLMAPLVWPILAFALAMVKGSLRLFQDSLWTLVKATLSILLVAYVIGLFSPFNDFGVEVISRTQPTLLELVIALASGFVAAFVISYPGLGSFIAGVVIASAIVPPLCVTALSFAENNLTQAGGSFLLFVANLIAMVLSAALFLSLAKFKPLAGEASTERRKSQMIWSLAFLIVIAIPLGIITKNIMQMGKQIAVVREVITAQVRNSEISDVSINSKNNVLLIEVILRASNNLSSKQMDILSNKLAEDLNASVNLQITIIPTLEGGRVYESEAIKQAETDLDNNQIKEINQADVFPEVK
ncbi:MAG: hypothetical protein COU22_03640 [Candidatus Komeilibacteria bacterium CG10_big_fil_rev_8_21_14_0_10_41_13]|uniref:TIGR00341 family protein n=1 Tax=Candidatus Komeilibacteria bacterium CG10_big_fil_rev_8_21_14_0_10_41_13 TaxID=1974476 RepID=A0A2M6WBI7_9BACT|nr:MAG: hypothetical protein COU22_03640 [Candidatus Komeilibacteria bacterium CG10_big_fil_rev_8_21_14_0_10_41_13]